MSLSTTRRAVLGSPSAAALIGQALAALQGAERALRQGQVPRPGDPRHPVNGYSRLTQPYFGRTPGLEAAVMSARDAPAAACTACDSLA